VLLSLVGAALAVVGSFLPWYSAGPVDVTAWDLRVVSLVTHEASDTSIDAGPILLIVILAALPLLTKRLLPGWASLGLAAVPLVLGVLGILLYLDLPEPRPDLGVGLILTVIGGAVMGFGVLVSPRLLPRPLIRLA
jgi:hypothetical protein